MSSGHEEDSTLIVWRDFAYSTVVRGGFVEEVTVATQRMEGVGRNGGDGWKNSRERHKSLGLEKSSESLQNWKEPVY